MPSEAESSAHLSADRLHLWNGWGRTLVFLLSSSSIACLLLEFYRVCPMRDFALYAFLPATVMLLLFAAFDFARGDRRLFEHVMLGLGCGLLAAVAYDIFRLPFVYSREWGLSQMVPPLALFKVFPRFGAMLLGQPIEQSHYSIAAQTLGWSYHFTNGATFGSMYVAMLGAPNRRTWVWGIVLALALEAGMLLSPYPAVFGIAITSAFLFATITAHGIFGTVLGLSARRAAPSLA